MSIAKNNDLPHEKREHERKNLAYDQVPGKFHVLHNSERIKFNQVNDVSISGMGILLDTDIQAGNVIAVGYESDDFSVALQAEIVWQEKLSEDVFRVGIKFSTENMNDNVMMFMALREYIDDFDEAL